jgi:hypothetical protein
MCPMSTYHIIVHGKKIKIIYLIHMIFILNFVFIIVFYPTR